MATEPVAFGPEFFLNTPSDQGQGSASVTRLADGGFFAVWTTQGLTGATLGQRFTASGQRIGPEVPIGDASSILPAVAQLEDGSIVVVWRSGAAAAEGDAVQGAILARRLAADGTPIDDAFLVNSVATGDQTAPAITALEGGGFFVAWDDTTSFVNRIEGRLFNSSGVAAGPEFALHASNADDQYSVSLSGLDGGGAVATWVRSTISGQYAIYARLVSETGAPLGDEFPVAALSSSGKLSPDVAVLNDGRFVVAWQESSSGSGGADADVKAQLFTSAGVSIGGVISVNTTVTGLQGQPVVTALADGGFAIAWSDWIDVGNDHDVKLQIFDSTGAKYGPETLANSLTAGVQSVSGIVALDNGRFVVAWTDSNGGQDSKAQIFGNNAPEITSGGGGANATVFVPENAGLAVNVAANDSEGDPLTYAIVGGADAARFTIDPELGLLSFVSPPDFETPADSNGNNIYVVEVAAADGLATDVQTISVVVTDVEEDVGGGPAGVTPEGSAIRVNTELEGDQQEAYGTSLEGGDFVIAYASIAPDQPPGPLDYQAKAQRFNENGVKIGSEFSVTDSTVGSQAISALTALEGGGFVAVWNDRNSPNGNDVEFRLFDASGDAVGGDRGAAGGAGEQRSGAVAALDGGRFSIVWQDSAGGGGDSSGFAVRGRLFEANGDTDGAEFLVNTTTSGDQVSPIATGLTNGNFIVGWIGGTSGQYDAKAQLFAGDGTKIGGEIDVATPTGDNHVLMQIMALADGRFAAAWLGTVAGPPASTALFLQLFDADGEKSGGEINLTSGGEFGDFQPSGIKSLPGDLIAVTWTGSVLGLDDSYYDALYTVFDLTGQQIMEPQTPHENLDGYQGSETVVALDDGRFAVVWEGVDADNDVEDEVFAQIYSIQGGAPQQQGVVILGTDGADLVRQGNAPALQPLPTQLEDVIYGEDGADRLDGWGGPDRMYGGLGNDTFTLTDIGDLAIESANEGDDLVRSAVINVTLAGNIERGLLYGSLDLWLTGNGRANALTGNIGDNVILGDDGGDVITGKEGNDTLSGGDDEDVLSGGDGEDVLGGGADSDTLNGGTGADTMFGGVGNDVYHVDNVGDVAREGAISGGFDRVYSFVDYGLGLFIENLTLQGGANLSGTGNESDNRLIGNSGSNILTALDGEDYLLGKLGNDTLFGGRGNDLLQGDAGVDIMFGGADDDYYLVDDSSDVAREDSLTGVDDGGNDTVGSAVDFTLGAFIEKLILTGALNIDGTGNALANHISGNSGANLIEGGTGADKVFGGVGIDTLYGGADNDTLDGGVGADSMRGGAGDDTYYVDNAADLITESNAGVDTGGLDSVISSVNYKLHDILGPNAATQGFWIENLTLTGSAGIGEGNAVDNRIVGNASANELTGWGGADTLVGHAGQDTLVGGDQNDVLLGGDDFDILLGLDGDDILSGGASFDLMSGGAGNDTYFVDHVNDSVSELEFEGVDSVISDVSFALDAFVENLRLTGTGNNFAEGNGLANRLVGNASDNLIDGIEGADQIAGYGGEDTVAGGVGADSLWGGDSADTLSGNEGADSLFGGSGADRFVFGQAGAANGVDYIADFASGTDQLAFFAADYAGLSAGALDPSQFTVGTTAVGGQEQFVYNATARHLSWDADGAGGQAAILLATFSASSTVTVADFFVM